MLSTKNVPMAKSVQDEVRSEPTTKTPPVAVTKSVPSSTVSLENGKTIERCEMKAENELSREKKRRDTDAKLEPFKPKVMEMKSCEEKMEKPKTEEKTEKTKVEEKVEKAKAEGKVEKAKTEEKLEKMKTEEKVEKAKTVEKVEKAQTEEMVVKAKADNKGAPCQTEKIMPQTKVDPQPCKLIPIADKSSAQKPSNVAVPRKCPPLSTPLFGERPLVLTTHLVPSLPIGLFEVFVEAIEVATEKPVTLLYEPRSDRPVAKEVADIAILPASVEWEDGVLLPVSFCFHHHLNKNNSPFVYVDVVVAADRASHIQDITDLRGHRCSLPDRKRKIGAATLLFNYLYTKGESPAFFGNTLDADTQVATLQMVAGKQVEVGILESPVIKCQKSLLPGIDSLHILTSLGPLPPYRIMVKKTLSDALVKKIIKYLLNINQDKEWVDRFAPFGVTGFTWNSEKFYELGDIKSVVTSVPYY